MSEEKVKKKFSGFQKLLWIFLTITLGLPQAEIGSLFGIITTLLAFAFIIYLVMWLFRRITIKNKWVLKIWKYCRILLIILMSGWLIIFVIGIGLVILGIE